MLRNKGFTKRRKMCVDGEEPVHRFALIFSTNQHSRYSEPLLLELLLSTNQIFRHEKTGKNLTVFYYKIVYSSAPFSYAPNVLSIYQLQYIIIKERKAFSVFPAEIFDWSRAKVSA